MCAVFEKSSPLNLGSQGSRIFENYITVTESCTNVQKSTEWYNHGKFELLVVCYFRENPNVNVFDMAGQLNIDHDIN